MINQRFLEDRERPLFMISVAAELAEMHPQTLRMYERRGLVCPQRSVKSTRLYSLQDVDRLRRIQELVSEGGLNLAGVELVLQMEEKIATMERKMGELKAEMEALISQAQEQLEEVHRSYRKELVFVGRAGEIILADHKRSRRI